MSKIFQYKCANITGTLSMSVIDPETGSSIWQRQYPCYYEENGTGDLLPDETPMELGLMTSQDDVPGLSEMLRSSGIIGPEDSVEKYSEPLPVPEPEPVFDAYKEGGEIQNFRENLIDLNKKIAKQNKYYVDGDFMVLYHGTTPANHKKILKSGEFHKGTWFSADEATARRFGGQGMSRGEPVITITPLYMGSLLYNGFFTLNEDLHFVNGKYQPEGMRLLREGGMLEKVISSKNFPTTNAIGVKPGDHFAMETYRRIPDQDGFEFVYERFGVVKSTDGDIGFTGEIEAPYGGKKSEVHYSKHDLQNPIKGNFAYKLFVWEEMKDGGDVPDHYYLAVWVNRMHSDESDDGLSENSYFNPMLSEYFDGTFEGAIEAAKRKISKAGEAYNIAFVGIRKNHEVISTVYADGEVADGETRAAMASGGDVVRPPEYRVIGDPGANGPELDITSDLTLDEANNKFDELVATGKFIYIIIDHPQYSSYGHITAWKDVRRHTSKMAKGGEVSHEDILEKVEKHLTEKQKKKEFKDVGKRVAGSKKEMRAYTMITMADLPNIEENDVVAHQLVTKDKVYPEVNVAEQRAAGVSSGAAFIKVKIREACGQRPPNDKRKRAAFIRFIQEVTERTKDLKTVEAMRIYMDSIKDLKEEEIIGYFVNQDFFNLIDELKQRNKELFKTSFRHSSNYSITKGLLEEIFGKRFSNFMYMSSDPAKLSLNEAWQYQGITADEEKLLVGMYKEQKQKFIDGNQKKADEYRNCSDEELKTKFYDWSGMDRFRKDMVGFRQAAIDFYEKRVKDGEKAKNDIPQKLLQREDNWTWFEETKGKKTSERSGEPTINAGEPLSYIKRTGGLVIDNKYVDEAKSTDTESNPITRDFGFLSVQYGNAMKNDESRQHVKHFLGAMADMSEILDIDIKALNSIGGLSMAFGARGKGRAMAHYESGHVIINITNKRGDGTVAHEYGHYFDNAITIFGHDTTKLGFASQGNPEATRRHREKEVRLVENEKVAQAMYDIMNFIRKGEPGVTPKIIKQFAAEKMEKIPRYFNIQKREYENVELLGSIDETLAMLAEKSKLGKMAFYEYPELQKQVFGYVIHHFGFDFYDIGLETNTSAYGYYSGRMKSKYWSDPVELFARAWETYIFDKLDKVGRMNNYLVSGHMFEMKIRTADSGFTYVYPFGDEREHLFKLYDNLVETVKREYNLASFQAFTEKREDEYLVLDDKKDDDSVEAGVVVEEESKAEGGFVELLAPNGKKSNLSALEYKTVRSPEFKKWFGDWEKAFHSDNYKNVSKVIDENGEPLLVHHGTTKQFTTFSLKHAGKQSKVDWGGLGFFFSPDKELAEDFTRHNWIKKTSPTKKGSHVMQCFIKLINPHIVSARQFTMMSGKGEEYRTEDLDNYDGWIIKKFGDDDVEAWKRIWRDGSEKEFLHDQFVVFHANQIKAADGTNTTFSANDDIRFEEGGSTDLRKMLDSKKFKKGGPVKKKATELTPEEKRILRRRWKVKREAINRMAEKINSLKRRVRLDLDSENEKDQLTALVVRIMLQTSERIGNGDSADNGHFGITEFRKKHIRVEGDRIFLDYVGKSGVDHEKEFTDPKAATLLKELLKRDNEYIFVTTDGFRIRPEKVNRYLSDFNVTSKDIRGFNSNRMMVMKLRQLGKVKEEKDRKKLFNLTIKKIAQKIGHKPATLRKHYLLPEIEHNFYTEGTVGNINLE